MDIGTNDSATPPSSGGKKTHYRGNPWFFVPSISLWSGMVNVVLFNVPTAMLKDLGYSNVLIGLSSLITIPYALKFLWGPVIDAISTKRKWILRTIEIQLLLWAAMVLLLVTSHFTVAIFFGILFLVSLSKSPQEIALVGFYLTSLTKSDQARFIGIRPLTSRLAMVFTGSLLLGMAGIFGKVAGDGDMRYTWGFYFLCLLAVYAIGYLWTQTSCPYPLEDKALPRAPGQGIWNNLKEPFVALLKIKYIGLAVLFILFIRSGEAFIHRMVVPFYMDPPETGGYGADLAQVGFIGMIGLIGASVGAVISGFAIKKYGLRRIMLPFVAAAIFPSLIYTALAVWHVDWSMTFDLTGVGINYKTDLNIALSFGALVENFGYGLGYSAAEYFLFSLSRGKYQTSIAGFLLSILYVVVLVFGAISGWVQSLSGWGWFFVISVLVSVPVFLVLPRLRYVDEEASKES
jgi:PAT family beta-lactamase induction signal transducer AmpG